jgi:hypothetical protein
VQGILDMEADHGINEQDNNVDDEKIRDDM